MNASIRTLKTRTGHFWLIRSMLVVGVLVAAPGYAAEGIRLNMDEQLGSQSGRSGWDAVGLKHGTPEAIRFLRPTRLAKGDLKPETLNARKVEMARRMFLMALSYR